MSGVIDLKASFLDSLELRGVPGSEHELYARVLQELASFLQRPPQVWTRPDLERFLRLRAPLLAVHERMAYVTALGIITELVERLLAQHTHIRLDVADLSLETAEQAVVPEEPEHTDFLSETIERIVTRPRTAPVPTVLAAAVMAGQPAALAAMAPPASVEAPRGTVPGSGAPRSAPKAEQTDFLAENIHDWREKTGRRGGGGSVRTTGALSTTARATGPLTPVPRSEPMRSEVSSLGAGAETSAIASSWAPGGWVELEWQGFVAGKTLRDALDNAVAMMRQRGGRGVLADMREASVLSQEDADWFALWLQRSAEHGLRRFAIVNPERVISRMQLSRLRHLADASSVQLPMSRRVQIAFFDLMREAREWLAQP